MGNAGDTSQGASSGPLQKGVERYGGQVDSVTWSGVELTEDLVKGVLYAWRERAYDAEQTLRVVRELHSLATTDMQVVALREAIENESIPLPWELGEALAETLLQEWHGAIWVWNSGRDRRTRHASLPGADIVGMIVDERGVAILFGEVKTSSDARNPPQVMYSRTGMIHQLEGLCDRSLNHFTLLRWLRVRCTSDAHLDLYKRAARRYVESEGRDLALVGCLVRDTTPHENDLKARATALSTVTSAPTRAMLVAWYVPLPMSTWHEQVGGPVTSADD
ncbi:hypothetical protein JOD67_001650 [Tenggerimyces flavus]|nr:hypothetical protein [Tenggerimyces flavus]